MPCWDDGKVFPYGGARKDTLGVCISGNNGYQRGGTAKEGRRP